MRAPRIMIAATGSGCGKTTMTSALLLALKRRGLKAAAFKCGPDYIDPMFHSMVLQVPSVNLDTYFTDADTARYLFLRRSDGADISVLEGVMGYYDGVAGKSLSASSYDLAHVTDTPVILIVNGKGMSLSIVSQIAGYLKVPKGVSPDGKNEGTDECLCEDSHIRGVILNRVSPSVYPVLKELIEKNLPVKVFGYLPDDREFELPSRHLGLIMPNEGESAFKKTEKISKLLEKTVDIDAILRLSKEAPDLIFKMPERILKALDKASHLAPVNIAVAADEAFCFYYEDNIALLKDMGAKIHEFSPIHDTHPPMDADALMFGGGYPELFAAPLSENRSFIKALNKILDPRSDDRPSLIAECGGFMYLHDTMEDDTGRTYYMAGIFPGHVKKTDKLVRFGYIELTAKRESILGPFGCSVKGHEFHYFDSSSNGDSFRAHKPLTGRGWDCMLADRHVAVGFPHLYYYSNPEAVLNIIKTAGERRHV